MTGYADRLVLAALLHDASECYMSDVPRPVDAAIKSLSRVILKEYMSTSIIDAIKTEDTEAIEALNEAIDKFIK